MEPYNAFRDFQSIVVAEKVSLADRTRLLKSEHLSDFTIKCESKSFRVHKSQIYTYSKFFEACIDSGFKESHDNEVTLKDTSVLAVAMLILLMYQPSSTMQLDQVYAMWPGLAPSEAQRDSFAAGLVEWKAWQQKLRTRPYNLIDWSDRPTPETLKPLKDHQLLETLTQVRLYELADRLMMPSLCETLAAHLVNRVEDGLAHEPVLNVHLSAKDTPTILEHIHKYTPPNDGPLRMETTAMCLRNKDEIDDIPGVLEVIEAHESYAWNLALAGCSILRDRHIDELDDIGRGLEGITGELQDQLDPLNAWKEYE